MRKTVTQMTVGTKTGEAELEFTYYPDGLRRSKTVRFDETEHVTYYVWNENGQLVAEMNAQYVVTRKYVRVGSQLVKGIFEDGEEFYYLHNAHGDVTGLANGDGEVVERYTYGPFGELLEGDPQGKNPFRYCGEYVDIETGNIYLRARIYTPANGRFTQEDPAMDGTNWYVYCGNNPIVLIDPLGLAPTALEAAYMADHIYKHDENDSRDDRTIAGWRLIDVWVGREGMKMGFYIRDTDDWKNPTEYVIVFKGTTWYNPSDLKNDVEQFISSKSADMWDAIGYSQSFAASHSQEITFVGHSKGGAEAAAAAVATNRNAILFNPANANIRDYGLDGRKYTGNMTQYVVQMEALSCYFLGPVSRERIPSINTVRLKWQHSALTLWGQIWNHMMSSVIDALEKGDIVK